MSKKSLSQIDNRERISITFNADEVAAIDYWAKKKGVSRNEIVRQYVRLGIRYENKDYDIPDVEVVRLNQLVEGFQALSFNVANLERTVENGFNNLFAITQGGNYLNKDDSFG